MNELALFAGIGGGILGSQMLGHRTVCAVEIEPYCREVLLRRQRDGLLPLFPIWDDIRTFDGKSWAGIVDIISGGFPCQDISPAGRGAGITGGKSQLWFEMFRIICEVRPKFVFVENSSTLNIRGLDAVLGNLASIGYDAEWGVLGANAVGAPHRRERTWILANSRRERRNAWPIENIRSKSKESVRKNSNELRESIPNTKGIRLKSFCKLIGIKKALALLTERCWWEVEPELGRVAHGVSNRVDRLKAIGNAQVPLCAATAFKLLNSRS